LKYNKAEGQEYYLNQLDYSSMNIKQARAAAFGGVKWPCLMLIKHYLFIASFLGRKGLGKKKDGCKLSRIFL
jgi:hypothetical protein